MQYLKKKIYDGSRITPEEALVLFSWDIIDLGKAADMRRKMASPGKEVGFIIDRIVNFTNVCCCLNRTTMAETFDDANNVLLRQLSALHKRALPLTETRATGFTV